MCRNHQEVVQCVKQLKLPLLHDAEGRWCINVITLCDVQIPYVLLRSDGSVGKESTCNAGDPGLIPELGRSPGEGIGYPLQYSQASLGAQLVKNLPAMQETWVRSLGWEDPLEKGKATHPWSWPGEFRGLYSPQGHKESDTTERLSLSHCLVWIRREIGGKKRVR